MSEYGLKIKNFEAGSLYGYNIGIRDIIDSTDAMLTNSLFSDFLKENGLNIWKNESTRDVICIEFNYGTKSHADEIKAYNNKIKEINEKEASLTKQKIIEIIGNDKAYFKFGLNEGENLNEFLGALKN